MFDVHATEEEDRLVLLCALERLGGCTEEQLLRFAVETGLMTQFPFSLALASLKEAALVRESRHAEGRLLVLTPEGRQSMELFASRIRASWQEKLDANCAAWRRRVLDERSTPAAYEPMGSGYAVTLRALESGEEIFAMTLTAASSDGTELRVDIGKEVAGGSGSRYLMLRGDASTVYIVDGSLAEELTRPIYDMMRLPKATDVPAENFRGLMLSREERSAAFMTAAGEDAPLVWRCSGEDVTGDARLDAVLTLLSGLAPARCLDYNPSPEAVSLCGFDTPLIVTARYQSGETEQLLRLEIGGLNVDGTERCFRLGEDTTIYTLPLAELEPLLTLEQAFVPPAATEEAPA